MAFLFSLTGITAEGCNWRFISRKLFLNNTTCRTTFIPPAVDPEDPPINISIKKSMVIGGAHTV